jgi:signal transduction histidine kinase
MAIAELEGRRQFDVVTVGDTSGTWDPDRLLQVISNLLGNAIQHGERDAPVEVAVSGCDPATVVLEVSNAGALPVDSAGALFMPFATSNATTRGTGLGLYIVDQIVKAHGGVAGGETRHGRTCFTVRLPRHRASAPESSGGTAHLAAPPR